MSVGPGEHLGGLGPVNPHTVDVEAVAASEQLRRLAAERAPSGVAEAVADHRSGGDRPPSHGAPPPDGPSPSEPPATSRDPTGTRGRRLDLSG